MGTCSINCGLYFKYALAPPKQFIPKPNKYPGKMKIKPHLIAFLSTFISLLPLQIASAQAANETPHIEISGQGLVEAEPELLRWDIEVENRGPDIAQLAC